jgi:hypothetical protein
MNKRPLIMLLLLGPLVLCVSLFGQVTQITTQIVSQNEKTATYRVTNNSDKSLTCYSVAVDITHNDGEVVHGEESECRYDSKGALAPDAYRERTTNAEGNQVNHSGVATVDVRPILAVFQDGSSESMDKASFHHLMDGVKNDAEGTRMVLSTLQKSTNDPAKAVASLEEQRKYAAPQSLYNRQLRDAIAFLKKSPAPSELEAYRRRLQKSYDTLKPYAYLQPGGVK